MALVQSVLARGLDKDLTQTQRSFLYMSLMHSESIIIHQQAEKLYQANGVASSLDFELQHKYIIERFGRYPHRNEILKCLSTEQELIFLTEANSRF